MCVKLNAINKVVCFLLLVLLCLFAACKEPMGSDGDGDIDPDTGNNGNGTDDPYNNPNVGVSRDLVFSHASGLHGQSFSLTIEAAPQSAIYYTLDGSIPSPGKAGTTQYIAPISVQNRNGQANVLSAYHEQMYGVAGDRGNNIQRPYGDGTLTPEQVPKATVIRAIAVDASGKKSDVVTRTYFIGNNLAGYGNTRIVSLVSDPDGLVSNANGIMVRGPGTQWDGPNIYNFQQRGEDWERAAHLEIFDGGTSSRSVFSVGGVGIRVRGGWSRATGQKSFTVYFKEQWGIKNLSRSTYDLIPGAKKADGSRVDTFKGFMLRNGANDADYTKFYDVFLQDLLSDRSFATQAALPCIVYLNGEYWGPYNFQERYSDNHTGYKYGVENENVISYDNGEMDDGTEADKVSYYDPMIAMKSSDMSNQANYDAFCAVFDIQNFIDYWAAQIYIHNQDWPQNNYRLWRVRTPEANNPYGDTKWRYQMFDVEYAMGIYNDGSCLDAFERILTGDDSGHDNSKLFKALLANEEFCRKFVNTMMDLYNVNFLPSKFEPLLDSYANTYAPLMGYDDTTPGSYYSRWGRPWPTVFENNVGKARSYLNNIRNTMVYTFLPNYFGSGYSGTASSIGNAYEVTFSATGCNAQIKVNTVTVPSGWTGKYFSNNAITVTAPDVSGYTFGGWTVTNGTATTHSSPTTTVIITGNAQIIAKYEPTSGVVPLTDITLTPTTISNLKAGQTATINVAFTPANATYKSVLWSSSDETVATVDGNGLVTVVYAGVGTPSVTITAKALEDNNITKTCTVNVVGVTELLNLAERLQTLTPKVISDWSDWNTAFNNLPINPAGTLVAYTDDDGSHEVEVTFEITNGGGPKKLQVNDFLDWASGLRVMTRPSTPLEAGDRIEIKGTFLNGPDNSASGELIVNTGCGYDKGNGEQEWWRPLGSWSFSAKNTDFQQTFTLSAEDASVMNANPDWSGAFALRMNGIPNSNGSIVPTGIGSFSVEQIRIYRP